jgi:hypothetical protein
VTDQGSVAASNVLGAQLRFGACNRRFTRRTRFLSGAHTQGPFNSHAFTSWSSHDSPTRCSRNPRSRMIANRARRSFNSGREIRRRTERRSQERRLTQKGDPQLLTISQIHRSVERVSRWSSVRDHLSERRGARSISPSRCRSRPHELICPAGVKGGAGRSLMQSDSPRGSDPRQGANSSCSCSLPLS